MSARFASRQARLLLQRRSASTTSEAANAAASGATKAKEGAQETASKAASGLSRVTSSAGPAISKAASGLGNTLNSIGGRSGRVIGFVNSLIPPTVYYAKVGGELGKIIFQGRGMYPPTMQTVQQYLAPLRNMISNPSAIAQRTTQQATSAAASSSPQGVLSSIRNLDRATLATAGVIAAETVGFFSIGEMIGRFKVVGYRTDRQAHH